MLGCWLCCFGFFGFFFGGEGGRGGRLEAVAGWGGFGLGDFLACFHFRDQPAGFLAGAEISLVLYESRDSNEVKQSRRRPHFSP